MKMEKLQKRGKKLKCKAERVIDAAGSYVMPGFIDLHVHLKIRDTKKKKRLQAECGQRKGRLYDDLSNAKHKAGRR